MKLSFLWLKDWVDHHLSPEELAARLTSAGLETSISTDLRGAYANMVVGRVGAVRPHPDADNLRLCDVDIGRETVLIVCGAPNVQSSQKVPVALAGAKLPGGLEIARRKIRGVESHGMICSEAELGVGSEGGGIMVLDHSAVVGAPLAEQYELEDVIFEVDLTPNRGDCLSLLGVAREVAALTGCQVKTADAPDEWSTGIGGIKVYLENPDACPRYTAREITGVKVGPSPLKVRRRLFACGIRPINNVVDATNYVMLETGHPLHAFDRRAIEGGRIVVRSAHAGERLTTLDGREHTLGQKTLIVADGARGIALAGVMGGKDSEVRPDTADIILEAAYFDPVWIRRAARMTGLSSESSYRFERGVDPHGVPMASRRAAAMIGESGGGAIGGYADEYPIQARFPAIRLRTQKVSGVIGMPFTDAEVLDPLHRLGFVCEMEGEGIFAVVPPPHRHDIKIEVDLIEEIARLRGFENIPSTTPRLAQHRSKEGGRFARRSVLGGLLASAGFYESVNYSFINPAWRNALGLTERVPPAMDNRVNADLNELRTALLPGLVNAVAFNMRQGEKAVSLFETGAVFRVEDGQVKEDFHTAGVMTCGEEELLGAKLPRDFHRLKGILHKVIKAVAGEEPLFRRPAESARKGFYYTHRQAEIVLRGAVVGTMGQLHPLAAREFDLGAELVCFEISTDALIQSRHGVARVAQLPRYPGVKRDLALMVDETVEAGSVVETILGTDSAVVRGCGVFDVYRGAQVPQGKKSLAFWLFFQDPEKTLTDAEGDAVVAAILKRVKELHGAEIRG